MAELAGELAPTPLASPASFFVLLLRQHTLNF
jgi:hypothetical protein